MTVTVNEHKPPPVAEPHVTVVVPTGNKEPERGTDVTLPQTPLVAGSAKVTTSWPSLFLSVTVIFGGQVNAQVPPAGWTVIVKEQEPPPAEDVHVTVVDPTLNVEPDGGVLVTVPHVPLVVGAA